MLHSIISFAIVICQFSFYGRYTKDGTADINTFGFYFKWFILIDCIQALDWFFSLRTGHLNDEHRLDYDWRLSLSLMSKGEKILKIFGTVPFEIVVWFIIKKLNLPYIVAISAEATKFGSIYALSEFYFAFRLIKLIYYYQTVMNYYDHKLHKLYGSPWSLMWRNIMPLFVIVMVTSGLNYYLVCTTNTVPYNGACQAGSWAWLTFNEHLEQTGDNVFSDFQRTMVTIYWKIKIYTTFSLADILPSYQLTRQIMFFEMMLGTFLVSTVTALTTAIFLLSTKNSLLSDYKAHIVLVKNLLAGHDELLHKVIQTKKTMFFSFNGFVVNGLYNKLDNLFPNDKIAIAYSEMRDVCKHINLLKNLPPPLIMNMSLKVKSYVYVKGQELIKSGTCDKHLYYITKGYVDIVDNKGNFYGSFQAGQCFNLLEFIVGDYPARYNVIARTDCEIKEWHRDELYDMFTNQFPVDNIFTGRIADACRTRLDSIVLTKKVLKTEEIKKKNDRDVPRSTLPDSIEEMSFNPNAHWFFIYSCFDKVRLLAHICLACLKFSFTSGTDSSAQFNWVVPTLFAFDIISLTQVIFNIFSERTNTKTNMPVHKTSINFAFYYENGLIFDFITIILPMFDAINGLHILTLLRIFQYRQADSFFNFIKNNIAISPMFNFMEIVYRQVVTMCCAITVFYAVAKYEGKQALANDPSSVYSLNATGGGDIYVRKDSWLGVSITKNLSMSSFRQCSLLTSGMDIFIITVYFLSDTINGVGAGHIYPQRVVTKVLEVFLQVLGLYMNITIAATFSESATISDFARENFESQYLLLKEFFEKSGHNVSLFIKEDCLNGYALAWKEKSGSTNKAIGKGLSRVLNKEVYHELYKEYMGDIFENHQEEFDNIVNDFNILAVPSNTLVVRQKSIVDLVFFVGKGKFELKGAGKSRILQKGEYYLNESKLASHNLICQEEGKLLTLPKDKITFSLPKINKSKGEEQKEHHYETPYFVSLIGCIQFLIVIYRMSFEGGVSVEDPTKPNRNTGIMAYTLFIDFVMFIYLTISVLSLKCKYGHFNKEEFILIIALLPTAIAVQAWNKILWFYIIQCSYERSFNDITANIYIRRLGKYSVYALLVIFYFMYLNIRKICPQNVCEYDSMARDFYQVFAATPNATTGLYPQIKDISRGTVFLDIFYVTLVLFSATGYGNIVPQSTYMMLHHTVCVYVGRFVMGLVLGLSRDIAESALESIAAEYSIVRNRFKHMLEKLSISKYWQDYVTGYIDANFLRSHNANVNDIIKGGILTPAVESDVYFDLIGKRLMDNKLFNGMSAECIREIALRATNLENYFSGHVIQNQGSPVDGILLILEGSLVLGKRSLKVAGDCIFAHHFYEETTAKINVYAYIRSEIVKLDKQSIFEIFKYYPEDEVKFHRNVDSMKDTSVTNLIERATIVNKKNKPSVFKTTSVASNVVHPM